MSEINFNALAWNAPKHGDSYGYIPSDGHYDDIITWLKSGKKLYTEKITRPDGIKISISRVTFENSPYDAVVTYTHNTKMVMWCFRKSGTFAID